MSTNGVNGATPSRAQLVAQLEAAQKRGDYAEVSRLGQAILKFDEEASKGGIEVESNPTAQPLTEEQQAAKDAAKAQRQKEIEEMKAAAQGKNAGAYADDMGVLREGTDKIKTKEGAISEGFSQKNAKKIAKAAKKVNNRIDGYEAVQRIYTNKDEYKKAVEAAKKDGTWDKDNPKYTLLEGKSLEGAQKMQQEASQKVDEALKNYKKYEAIYNNPKSEADKQQAFREMCDAAKLLSENYNASKMFDEGGNINKEAYQKTMLQYSGTDLKANLDERKALRESADVSKRKAKDMFEAAGLDVEKDYTWAMRAGTLAVGVGTGALVGLLGGGLAAQAVATAVSSATATATATATGTNVTITDITASNGEQFIDVVEDPFSVSETVTTTVTNTVTETGVDAVSRGTMAGRGALAALPAAILSAALAKDNGGADAFNGLTAEQVLKNAGQVKGKANKELVQKIIDMPNLTTNQKAAILHAAYGDNTAKKVNTEELVAAYTAAKYLDEHPELVNPTENETSTPPTTTTPTTPTTTTPTITTPTITNVEVWDIDGDGFLDAEGNKITVKGHEARGSVGHARDWEKLKQRHAPTDHNDPEAKAQYIIADERGEIRVTPSVVDGKKNYEQPETIKISDNTNGKVNTYEYRKLTDEEVAAGKTKDGQTLTGLQGKKGPFYIQTSAYDSTGNLKANHLEVFQLEIEPHEEVVEEKDENGNITRTTIRRNNYRLEQYKGMNGSGRTSMDWVHRKTR